MCNPRSIKAHGCFAGLILSNLGKSTFIDGIVLSARYKGGHSTHRVSPTLMASSNEQFAISLHERHVHRDLGPIRQDAIGPRLKFFNHAKNIIPSSCIET